MTESATLTEVETDSSVTAPEDLAAELARLDEQIPALEHDVEQLRSRSTAMLAISAAAASAVTKAAATRADRDEIARLRADQLAADDELTAIDAEENAGIAALHAARERRRTVAILLAERQHASAVAEYRELVAAKEPLILAFVTEVLDPLLTSIEGARVAAHNAWWDEHEARGTPPRQRGQSPYLVVGRTAPSVLDEAITAITGFARGTTPRQVADRDMRGYVESLRAAFASLRDPRSQRAPNDPPANPRADSVPFAQTGDGHYVERTRAAAGKLSATPVTA